MKFIKISSILFLLCAASLSAQGATGTATKIATTWTASVYPAGTANCSATVTSNCQNGYTATITPPSGAAIVIPNCTTTVTTNCIAAGATTYTYTSPTALNYGTYSVSIVANGLGSVATGATTATPLTSSPGVGASTYAPSVTVIGAPGGVSVSFQ